MSNLLNRLSFIEKELNTMSVSSAAMDRDIERCKQSIAQCDMKIQALDMESIKKSQETLVEISREKRLSACKMLEGLCTAALQYTMGANYEAKIVMGEYGSRPSAEVYIRQVDIDKLVSPYTSGGGGVVDIISTALRFVLMEVWDGGIDGPIILDESYKHLSAKYIPLASEFLSKIQKDFNRQIIFCTHNPYLAACAKSQVKVTMDKGISFAESQQLI